MSSSEDYWREREAENLKHNLKTEEEYQKALNEQYDYMMDQIQKEINGFYAKYAKKEGITLTEAKKRVSELDMKEYERKAKKYVANRDFSDEANEEMRLYNATMKINRLELLKANIGLELVDGFDGLQKYFDGILTERTLEEFKRQAGILGETIQNNAERAKAIVNASFNNATFSDRIWMYQGMMKAELAQLLTSGLVQGKSSTELARHLSKRFGVSKTNAERLMVTEIRRVQTEAARQSYIKNGVAEYTFLTANAKGPCDECRALDYKHFKVKDMKVGVNAPPMHPRCHCTTAPYEDEKDYQEWLDFLEKGGTTKEWNRLKMQNEMEESKPKYKYGNTVVNRAVVDSSEFRKRIDKITDNTKINRSIWKRAKEILEHRNGTKFEDLVYIDSLTGKSKINKDYDDENHAKPNKAMEKMLKDAEPYTIIGVHNHPASSVPSLPDIKSCIRNKYRFGIVVCHDGKLYKYSVEQKNFIEPIAIAALERMHQKGYTNDIKKMFEDAGIHMEVLDG